jgi:hypothetical protein
MGKTTTVLTKPVVAENQTLTITANSLPPPSDQYRRNGAQHF